MRLSPRNSARLLLVGAMGVLAPFATAEPIPVVNHSFEADFAAPNTFPVGPVTGWSEYDGIGVFSTPGNYTGVLNPTGSTFFPAGAPDGSNVAILYFAGNIGGGSAGYIQTLDAVLEAGRTYTLTVDVGNIASGTGDPAFDPNFYDLDGFPGYSVRLQANGVVLVEDYNTIPIPEGEFVTTSLEYTAPEGFPVIGLPLEIVLLNLNQAESPQSPGIEVDFDNVRLDITPLCPPDVNSDGILDNGDIGAFVGLFLAGDAAADFNGDGLLDNGDIGSFVTAFLAGCG